MWRLTWAISNLSRYLVLERFLDHLYDHWWHHVLLNHHNWRFYDHFDHRHHPPHDDGDHHSPRYHLPCVSPSFECTCSDS
jgi:hypothetical protein